VNSANCRLTFLGPPRQFRVADRRQAPNPLDQFRRQDPVAVYPRPDDAGNAGLLQELYGTDVSPTLISSVTIEDAKAWQSRPLDALYPIGYLDGIHVKVRDAGTVRVKAVYLALGINLAGEKE